MSSKPRVLLIDDDEWLSAQYARLLVLAGYEVSSVIHSLDAIDAIEQFHPTVIVLDLFMPGSNGIVLLHELRSHSDLMQIPVILCTNSAKDFAIADFAAYGVVKVLDKTTMHPEDIVTSVRKVFL